MERVRIAALGDSITKGVVLGEENNYSVLEQNFMEIISESKGVEVENYGRFGSTIDFAHHVVKHHEADIAGAKYTFIEYGGNDAKVEIATRKVVQNRGLKPRELKKATQLIEMYEQEIIKAWHDYFDKE